MRPKPTALKLLTGNPGKRPLNPREPSPPLMDLGAKAPEHWSDAAKAAWPLVRAWLVPMGVATISDWGVVEEIVETYAELRQVRDKIAIVGRTYKTKGGMKRPCPEVADESDLAKRLRLLLVEHGLTPASRSKVTVPLPALGIVPRDRFADSGKGS